MSERKGFGSSKFNYRAGTSHMGTYLAPGDPFLTRNEIAAEAANLEVEFTSIARSVTIINDAANDPSVVMRVHFTANTPDNGVFNNANDNLGHFVRLGYGDAMTFDVKCSSIFITREDSHPNPAVYTVMAELTGIQDKIKMSGTGIDD